MIRTAVNTYWQSAIVNGRSFLANSENKVVHSTKLLVSVFYFFNLFTSIQPFSKFYQTPDWQTLLDSQHLFEPLWSVRWISYLDWNQSIRFILLFYLIASAFALLFWERSRLARIIAFASIFLYLSLISSFGKIDHNYHLLLIIMFMLIFLPSKSQGRISSEATLKVFFSIQTFILLTYFISGIFKLYGIIDQEIRGDTSALAEEAMALNLSKTSYASGSDYFLSSYLLGKPSKLFSAFLILGYLVEFFSVYVLFKPQWHRVWACLLIMLHVGIVLSVGPDFTIQIFVVGIFLLFSPFSSADFDLSQNIRAAFQSLIFSLRPSPVEEFVIFYDGDCMMCNGFLKFLARFDLPQPMKICPQQSTLYANFKLERPDLAEIDSIVVLEKKENGTEVVRLKAKGVIWVLIKVKLIFYPLKWLFAIAPFIGNLVYDMAASNRKIDPSNCPIPPAKMMKITVNSSADAP